VNNSKRPETVNPGARKPAARRRGRPPLPADEAKRSPLTIRTTEAQKEELLRAAKAAGRSLAEEIDFRLGAVRAHPPAAQGEIDQTLPASLDFVMELMVEVFSTLREIESWIYSITLDVQKAVGPGGAKLMWDDVDEKFVTRLRPENEPKPPEPKPKRKSRRQ
jgi:hypothetical protein